jgi:hypothetical protein
VQADRTLHPPFLCQIQFQGQFRGHPTRE